MDILNEISLFLQTSVQMGTHILFAIVGGIICEKVGNMNLGIEGMMLMGAAVGFQVACATANPFLAVLSAGLAGLVGALIYAFITVTLRGNQVVTGLVLTIFGTGVAGFIGKSVSGNTVPAEVVDAFKPYDIPVLCDIPIIGKALFSQSGYVQAAIVVAILAYLYIKKTKFGLNMRAVGENPAAADASGINVTLYKYVHVLAGGFLCGVGGAYLSTVFLTTWQDNVTAARLDSRSTGNFQHLESAQGDIRSVSVRHAEGSELQNAGLGILGPLADTGDAPLHRDDSGAGVHHAQKEARESAAKGARRPLFQRRTITKSADVQGACRFPFSQAIFRSSTFSCGAPGSARSPRPAY